MRSNLHYEFGPYRLDPNERLLTRAGDIISLRQKLSRSC